MSAYKYWTNKWMNLLGTLIKNKYINWYIFWNFRDIWSCWCTPFWLGSSLRRWYWERRPSQEASTKEERDGRNGGPQTVPWVVTKVIILTNAKLYFLVKLCVCIYLVVVYRAWATLLLSCLRIYICLVFLSVDVHSLPLSPLPSVHSKYLYSTSLGKTTFLYLSSKFL